MALGADRYASRGDTLVFLGCVLLSVAAMSLPERIRDPLARDLRQTVLAPFLALQQQTELLSASLERYDAVVAQRDSAALPPPSSPSCGARTRGSGACSAWAHGSRAATRRPRCYAGPSPRARSRSSCRRERSRG